MAVEVRYLSMIEVLFRSQGRFWSDYRIVDAMIGPE